VTRDRPIGTEQNTNIFTGSTLTNTSVATGSRAHAEVSVELSPHEAAVTSAIAKLRQDLEQAQASLDEHDDETREKLLVATNRLAALEKELKAPKPARNWERVSKFLSGIRDTVVGLTSLTASADALRDSVEQVFR